ncbi:MAG: hypothetical protein WBQ56_17900 [Candidatus Sulfotelmatobacter sp.]
MSKLEVYHQQFRSHYGDDSERNLYYTLRATPLPISAEEFLATRDAHLIPQGKLRMAV